MIKQVGKRTTAVKRLALLAMLVFVLLALVSLVAQDAEKAARTITPDSFHAHIKFLADPKLEGRLPGTPEIRKAGHYIADKLRSWGVTPKGEESGFFQKVKYTAYGKEYKCRNVVGIIPGTDEKLKSEIILIVAHYDHLGKGVYASRAGRAGRGKVHAGADDNASGTAGLLEIARAITKGKLKLKRSVLFLAVTGEEAGLQGSRYYVEHPLVPLEKTQAVINLDMIGCYKRGVAAMGVHMSAQFDKAIDAAVKGEDVKVSKQRIQGRGDNVSFNNRFIPSIFFWTGFTDFYHTPKDTTDTINKKKGAAVCRVALGVVEYLANADKIESALERPRGSAKPYLGVNLDEAPDGVKVTRVASDSPADKGGLKKGDIITAVAGRKVSSYRAFIKELNKHNPDDKVKVTVKRGSDTKKLEIKLGKR